MKLAIKVKNLLKCVNICSRIVSNRSGLEVLGNILLETDNSSLRVSSTNLDIAISSRTGAKVEKTGKVSVPARLLSEFIGSISSDTVQLISDGSNLTIKTEGIHSTINGVDANEFPTLPKLKTKKNINLDTGSFKDNLEKVMVSVGIDESRPVLAGIYFFVENGRLTLVGTDSYRLSEIKTDIAIKDEVSCIIPSKSVTELIKLISLEENSDNVEIKVGESEISFSVGDSYLISQLTDGKYPDYKKIIPKTSDTTVECTKTQIAEAVKVSSIFARESSHGLQINIAKDKLTIDAQTSDVGKNTYDVDVSKKGKDAQISINAKYLLDILNSVKSDKVKIELNEKLDPLVIKPKNKKDDETHIIMPLRS